MGTYQIAVGDKTYEVQADSPEEAARAFAPQQQQQPEHDTPPPSQAEEDAPAPEPKMGVLGTAIGAVDSAVHMARSSVGTIAGGLSGLVAGIGAKALGSDHAMDIAEAFRGAADTLISGTTHTPMGQKIEQGTAATVGAIGTKVKQALQAGVELAAVSPNPVARSAAGLTHYVEGQMQAQGKDFYEYLGGNPTAAALWKTLIEGAPTMVGVPGTGLKGLSGMNMMERDAAEQLAKGMAKGNEAAVAAEAEKYGFKLNNTELRASVADAAKDMLQEGGRGTGFSAVQRGVRAAELWAQRKVDQAWGKFRDTRAFVDAADTMGVGQATRRQLIADGHDVEKMPLVMDRLDDFSNLDKRVLGIPGPEGARTPAFVTKVSLKTVDLLRRRIQKSINQVANAPERQGEYAALNKMKSNLTAYVDDAFNNAAVSGDQSAYALWKNAIQTTSAYKSTFNADRVIRDLVAKEATPETVQKWALGATKMGMKSEATTVVKRLQQILGPNHPGMMAVRQSLLRDTLAPLTGEVPNFEGAIYNIDKLLTDNSSLVKEAGINVDDLLALKRASHAARFTTGPSAFEFNQKFITRILIRLTVGNGLAKNTAKMGLLGRLVDKMMSTGVMSEKDLIKKFGEATYKQPMVEYKDPSWKEIMLYGAAADQANDSDSSDSSH